MVCFNKLMSASCSVLEVSHITSLGSTTEEERGGHEVPRNTRRERCGLELCVCDPLTQHRVSQPFLQPAVFVAIV